MPCDPTSVATWSKRWRSSRIISRSTASVSSPGRPWPAGSPPPSCPPPGPTPPPRAPNPRHNASYWTGEPYAGLGPSAHGFAGRVRRWNMAPWAAYERTVHQGKSPEASREVLSAEEQSLERVYLGLRTRAGVTRSQLGAEAEALLEDAVRERLLERRGNRLRATPRGWLA